MGTKKIIKIDDIDVPFKASAALPRMYRMKFGRDIFKDFSELQNSVSANDKENSGIDFQTLEIFEELAWLMAKHADPENVSESPDEWLEQFNMLSIYDILPQLIDLWGMNTETQAVTKKNIDRLTAR